MIRFVVERHEMQHSQGIDWRDYVTVDVDLPELEALLKRGGFGENGFEAWRLLGAEILQPNTTHTPPSPLNAATDNTRDGGEE